MKNAFDRIIEYVSPRSAVKRYAARECIGYLTKRGFDGASNSDRFSGWTRPSTSANGELKVITLSRLRNASRDLTRNNPWAEKALGVITSNVVGEGIKAQIIGRNRTQDKRVSDAWKKWSESTDCDYEGKNDLAGLMSLTIRTVAESGAAIIYRRRIKNGNGIPSCIQILEPDFLDTAKDGDTSSGGLIYQGIEFDKSNKLAAYWIYTAHPGDSFSFKEIKSVRVPASEIDLIYDVKRPGQAIGYPWCTSLIRRLKDFDDYEDAQLVRQKIAASWVGAIYDDDISVSTGLKNKETSDNSQKFVQPGLIENLAPGKKMEFFSPPGVQNYGEYSRNLLLAIAAGYGITYESLTGDYSNVNFSSGRMGWIEMGRNVKRWQKNIMVLQFCKSVWGWFEEGCILSGIDVTDVRVKWIAPRREMVDPTREIPAKMKEIRAGMTSLSRVAAENGLDFDEIIEEIAKDNKKLDDLGLVFDTDPRKVNLSGSFNDQSNGANDAARNE